MRIKFSIDILLIILLFCSIADSLDNCENNVCKNGAHCELVSNNYICNCAKGYTGQFCETEVNCHESKLCKNGATCENVDGKYKCQCLNGWSGKYCDVNTDDCASKPCKNGGSCKDLVNHKYECHCPEGFQGMNCEFRDPCINPNPCMHGKCITTNETGSKCHCDKGYIGDTCATDVNECEINESPICENGGRCVNTIGSYYCECDSGFNGERCENDIRECKNETCLNGGECLDKIGYYQCICLPEFKGNNCEHRKSICEKQPCKNGGECRDYGHNDFECVCPDSWKGKRCEYRNLCQLMTCPKNKRCQQNKSEYKCICPTGLTGDKCDIAISTCSETSCLNGGICNKTTSECVCEPGFKGSNCEINIDDCDPNPCWNNAKCIDQTNDFLCSCPVGLDGKHCEYNIDDCAQKPCKNGARCEDRVGGFLCHCPPGFVGLQCDTKSDICNDLKPCEKNRICQNNSSYTEGYTCICPANNDNCKETSKCKNLNCKHGKCFEINNQEKCLCSPGFTGNQCEKEINECLNNPCQHGSQCQDLQNDYLCICANGYIGKNCEININDCANNPCGSHGVCIDEINGFRCECNLPFSGSTCSIKLDPCKSNTCANDAICIPGNKYDTYHCNCSSAIGRYEGRNCEKDIDECSLNYTQLMKYDLLVGNMPLYQKGPCLGSESRCMNTNGSFVCVCPNRLIGKQCEKVVDYCQDNPCKNGGKCDNLINGFKCQCAPGFNGSYCEIEINECENNPCRNGARCMDHINNYHCLCPVGFSGKNCDINDNDCSESSCLTNGICIDKVNNFTCQCFEKYTGRNCERFERPCDSKPCLNEGSCVNRKTVNNEPAYLCNCRDGYTGPRCEIKMDWCRGLTCGEYGNCTETVTSFKCTCHPDYTGEKCEIKKTDSCVSYAKKMFNNESLTSNICKHHGNCFDDPETGGFKCSCQGGYSGSFCEVNINECANQPCVNDGECIDGIGMHWCKCQPGFKGVNCQVNVNDCPPERCNHGKCIDLINNYTCVCPPGVTGRHCDHVTDFCKDKVCQNNGVCKNYISNFECQCPKGFTGKLCEVDMNECKYNIAGNEINSIDNLYGPCSPVGTLECLDRPGHFFCNCKPGFNGTYCHIRIDYCENLKKSGRSPCYNSGLCKNTYADKGDSKSGYKCICPSGFGGDRCEVNSKKCEQNTCKNGGMCRPVLKDEKMSFKCECPAGVGGLYCEIDYVDECETFLCRGGGRCENGFGKAICHCNNGYCGKQCEMSGNACSSPFLNDSQTFDEEIKQCKLNECASKADNKICDLECNKLACSFDGGECLHRVPKRIDTKDVLVASPWSHCRIIRSDNIPCHNWFGNKRCDPKCNTEACLFDGWDCVDSVGQCPMKEYCDKHYSDGVCQNECNTMECSFDGGDCLQFQNVTIPGGIILLLPISINEFVENYQLKLLQSLTRLLHSVVRVMRDSNGQKMIFPIRVYAETSNEKYSRQKRSASNSHQGKPGTKVFLEVDNRECKIISKQCFDNSNSAAEFVTAALHSKSYRPPVPILSVQTYRHRPTPFDVPPNGLVYVLVVMTCLVILGVLIGVLYGFMQNNSKTDDKKTKKAEIWYPEGMKRLNQPTSQFHHRRLGNVNRKRNQNLLNCHNATSELGNIQQMTKSKISTTDSIDDSGSNSLTSTRVTSYEMNIGENNNDNIVSENCMLLPNGDINLNYPPEKRLKLHLDSGKDFGEPRNIEYWCFNTIVQLLVSGNGVGEFSSAESRDKQIIVEKLLQIAINNQDEGNKFNDISNKNELSNNSLITILTLRVPYSGETLLHLASKFNRKEAVRFLLEAGSDPNKIENNGRSCLMTAIDAGALEVVAYLLEQQTFIIDLHQKGPGGTTCLIQAVKEAHLEIIHLLLQHIQPEECDLNVTDDYGRTALHWAAITGQTGVVHLLLSYGLNRDAQDNEEATPLYLACREGAIEVCKVLIANGANPDMSDHLDRLPRDIAKMNNFDNVVALLDDYINITKENQQHRPLMWGQYNCYSNNYYGGNPVDLKSVLYSSPHSMQPMSCCVYPNPMQPDSIEFKSKNMGFYSSGMSLQNQSSQACYRSNQLNYANQPSDPLKKRLSTHTPPNLQNLESKMRYQMNNKRNNLKSPNFIDYSSNNLDLPTVPTQMTNYYSCSGANNSFMGLSGYNTNCCNNNNPTSSTSAPGITPSPDSDSPGHWSTSSPSLSPRSKNQHHHMIMQNAQTIPNGQPYKSSVLHYHPSHETLVLAPNSASIQKNAIYRLHSRDNVCQY